MAIVMTIGMAKRRRARMVWIPFTASLSLSTLASAAGITAAILTLGEDFFLLGMKATWSVRGATGTQGPIAVGFAHGDLTAAEIVEWKDASVTDPDDIIAVERSRRPARMVGSFENVSANETLNDGKPITTRMKRSVGDGHAVNLWAINNSGSALTTGQIILCDGHLYGRWQR